MLFPFVLALCAPFSAISAIQESHLGEYIGTVDALARPVAAAFGPAGDEENALWVAEAGSAASPAGLRALSGIDASFSGQSAGRTIARAGVGVLTRPTGIAVDGKGNVYATDDVQHAVWRFAPDGTSTRLAGRGTGVGEVLFPTDVEVWPRHSGAPTHLCVADTGNRRAQLLDLKSSVWTEFRADAALNEPLAVAFLPSAEAAAGEGEAPVGLLVADGARHQIDRFQLDGTYVSSFSDWGFFPSLIASPGGIECADGLIFVADTENHRVQAFDQERPGDTNDGLRYRFGVHAIRPGEGDGSLHYPRDIAIDRDAVVVAIVEPLDDRIQIFGRGPGPEPKADPTRAGLGAPSAHLGELISTSGQYLATLSPESHRVLIHDMRGDGPVKISEVFGYGERLGMVRTPIGVHLADEGRRLLVTDRGNRRLTRARLDVKPNEPLSQNPELEIVLDAIDLGALGVLPGDVTLVTPPGEQAAQPLIAVVDMATDTVVLLDDDLQILRRIGASKDDPIVGIVGLTATPTGTLLVLDGFGGASQAATSSDSLQHGRVLEFDLDGKRLGSLGEGLLVAPAAAVAHGSRVWVTDAARDRVEVFDRSAATGLFEHTGGFGETGLGRSQFHEPRGLGITSGGRLIVLDHGNHRGQIFGLEGNFLDGFGGRLYTAPLRAAGGKTR
ncbi:NHL repeat protein [Planctomycetes bacterium Poly30]|uniref:NHL repeat protein n=1 Tax=Saltatorellus ferox TaxID=2528018 RepID=A0A518EX02_9BACT|nr:NHL repeat protein [Planctomycetes bacterium Poly30]